MEEYLSSIIRVLSLLSNFLKKLKLFPNYECFKKNTQKIKINFLIK